MTATAIRASPSAGCRDRAAASHEAPRALFLAEQLGHTHLLILAITLSALTLRLERRVEEYQSMVRRLRVLMDSADQMELNMPARAAALASAHQQHVGTERAFPLMLAAVDLMRVMGDGERADQFAAQMMKPSKN